MMDLFVIVNRALRPHHRVGGGAPVNCGRRRRRRGVEVRPYLISHTCFKSFSAKNFWYQGMHVEQLFFAVVWPHIRKNIIKTGLQ